MINPAQYTQVLQQASDGQLMQMLKRPDKIPSQFVVAEINRRQSMRQAAMADQQRQARVQEMMTAQQQMPQQQQPMQPRPMGMSQGGIPPVRSVGDFATFNDYRQYMRERDAAIAQRRALAQDRAAANRAMSGIATADAGMTDLDTAPNYLSDAEIVALEDARMTNIDAGIKEPFFQFGGVNPGAVFTDGNPADIVKAASLLAPERTASSGGRNNPRREDRPPAEARERGPGRLGDRKRRRDGTPTEEDRIAAARDRLQRFTPDDDLYGAMARRPTVQQKDSGSQQEGNIVGGPIGPEPGATDQIETEAKRPKTAQEVVKAMQDAAANDVATTTGGIKNNQRSGAGSVNTTGTLPALPGDDALKPIPLGTSGSTPPSADKGGITNTGQQPPETTGDKTERPNPFKITGETKTFTEIQQESNKEIAGLNDTLNQLRTQANEDQQKQLTGYKTDLAALMKAQKDLMGVLDKNSMTPENRIFRAMIDGGIALAGSKNANFLQAVAESTGKGLETFDRLNAEQKKNLFDKYSAAVDFAKAKVDISQGINRMQNEINQGQIDIASGMAEQARTAADALQTAAKLDFDAATTMSAEERAERGMVLKEDAQDLAREIFGFDQDKFAFNKSIAERGQAVKDLLANVTLFDTISKTNQADRKLDIMASGLDIQREELDFKKVSKAIDQQLEAMRLDQPPDAVAKLEFMKEEFGSDGLKEILLGREKSTTGDVTEDDILKAAIDMYKADPGAIIPGNADATQKEAVDYYAKSLREAFGKSGPAGQSAAGPADDTLDFGD